MNLLRLSAVALVIAAQLACQEPFGTDRHDLTAERVFGLVSERSGDEVTLRPLLVVDGRMWSDTPVALSWAWVQPEQSLDDALATPIAESPSLRFTVADVDRTLALRVRYDTGELDDTVLAVPAGGPTPLPRVRALDLAVHPQWRLSTPTEDDLARDARLALDPTPAAELPSNGWARLTAQFDSDELSALQRVRWMGLGSRGTFLELDRTRTDWAAGDLLLDDLEIEEATRSPDGLVTLVALAIDHAGGNRALVTERWLGQPGDGGLWVEGRWMTAEVLAAPGALIRATLRPDDAAPTGLHLDDVQTLTASDLSDDDPFGTETLPCNEPVLGAFDPMWLVDGRCSRAQVIDATVVLKVDP